MLGSWGTWMTNGQVHNTLTMVTSTNKDVLIPSHLLKHHKPWKQVPSGNVTLLLKMAMYTARALVKNPKAWGPGSLKF